jgi:carotenoid cleavage dioxygenase-like enzyme
MTTASDEIPLHLDGNNAPVTDEVTISGDAMRVVGELPAWLDGTFVRNGPNPRTGWSAHLFDGDGMVHGIELRDGRAMSYRNRYVRTPLHAHPGEARVALAFDAATGAIDHRVTTANTHIVAHAGRLLALEEGGLPYELTRELDTVGAFDFGGLLHGPMTAHPKRCAVTGELLFFGYALRPPYATVHVASADGRLVHSRAVDLPRATMMHDFAITASTVLLFDSPIVFDARAIAAGGSPWTWHDARPARFGVLSRADLDAEPRWIEVGAGHVSHVANAYDLADGRIVVTGTRVARDPDAPAFGFGSGLPAMHRWVLDPARGSSTEIAIDDIATEYPRITDARVGLPHNATYTVSFSMDARPERSEVHRFDDADDRRTTHRLPVGQTCGEPVFVARPGSATDDDGILLTFAHDRATDTGSLLVLDAQDLAASPIAAVHLPVRVPAGFHGSWVARGDLGAP